MSNGHYFRATKLVLYLKQTMNKGSYRSNIKCFRQKCLFLCHTMVYGCTNLASIIFPEINLRVPPDTVCSKEVNGIQGRLVLRWRRDCGGFWPWKQRTLLKYIKQEMLFNRKAISKIINYNNVSFFFNFSCDCIYMGVHSY